MRTVDTREVHAIRNDVDRPPSSAEVSDGFSVLPAEDIELKMFCPRKAHSTSVAAAAYELWHAVWFATFRYLDGVSHLDSNEFTRQDEILALFYSGRCISVTALRWVDRSTRIGREDSYFRAWPREALERVGSLLVISSNTAVAECVRRARIREDGGEPQRLSEITIALALRRFVASNFPEFVGVARNDRKMDRVATVLGGNVIGRTILHGIESDIMLFSRCALPPFGPAIEGIWSRRSRCSDESES